MAEEDLDLTEFDEEQAALEAQLKALEARKKKKLDEKNLDKAEYEAIEEEKVIQERNEYLAARQAAYNKAMGISND